jgi:TolA-binding protein
MSKRILILLTAVILANLPLSAQQSYWYTTSDPEYLNAMELYKHKKFGSARLAFEQYRQKNQNEASTLLPEAAYYEANCARELDNDDALSLYEQFLVNFPESNKVPYVQFHAGELLQDKGKFKQAVRWYEKVDAKALDQNTRSAYNFKAGYCLFMSDDIDSALPYFIKVKDIDNQFHTAANYYYSHIQYQRGNYDTALKGFLKLEKDEVFKEVVPFYIAQIYYLQKDYDKAINYGTPMLETGTSERRADIARIVGGSWFAKKDYAKAAPLFEKAVELSKNPRREDYYHLGFCWYYRGNYAKAAENLSQVTSGNDSMSQNAYYHLGDCYLKLKDKKRARVAFEAAAKFDFDKAIQEDALFNQLKLNYELSFSPFNEIISSFLRFIELFPNSDKVDQAYDYLGKAFLTTKNYKQALESMEKIKRKDANVYRSMQRIACYRGLELFTSMQFNEAIGFFTQSLKHAEYDKSLKMKALYWRGEAWYRLGELAKAKADYNEFILIPGSFSAKEFKTAHYNLGYVHFKSKDYTEAGNWFRKHLRLSENEASAITADSYNRVGDCFYMARDYQSAISNYDRAAIMNVGNADYAMYQKGFCLGLLKRHDEKIAILKKLSTQYPSSPYVDDAMYEIGRSYVAINDLPNAIYSYKTVKEKYPQSSYGIKSLLQLGLVYYNNNDLDNSLLFYKRVVNEYPSTPEAQDAMLGIRNIYMDRSNPDGYFRYAETLGGLGKTDVREQDSLTYITAERFYMKEECTPAIKHFESYINSFPNGRFILDTHFYKADCQYRMKADREALASYEFIAGRERNRYTEESLLRAGEIHFREARYDKALASFQRLKDVAEMAENLLEARIGEMRSLVKLQDYYGTIQSANQVVNAPKVAPEIVREARFALGKAYLATDKTSQALTEFQTLASNTKSIEGAESKYLMAQLYSNQGNDTRAEQEIFDFADKGTPHQYWLARSFILLSDIYLKKDDHFQARQYLEGILENYTGNDDIRPMVNERLNRIKTQPETQKTQEIQLK